MQTVSGTHDEAQDPVGREAWTVLILLTIANFFNALDRTSLSLVLEPIKHEFGASDTMMSILAGFAYAATYGVAAIPLAVLADRGASRRVLGFCLAVWSGATLMCGFAQRYTQLLVARAAVGMGEAGGIPASLSLISSHFPSKRRPWAMSIFYSANGLSLCIGVPIFSMIVATWGWRAGFYVSGAAGLLFVPFLFRFVREPRAPVDAGAQADAPREKVIPALRAMCRNRPFVLVLLSHFLVFTGVAANTTFTVAYFIRNYGLSYEQVAALNGVPFGVAGVVGGLAGGALVARLVRRSSDPDWMNRISAASAIASALCLVVGFSGLSLPISAAGCIFGYFFIMARYGTSYAAALEYVPSGSKGAVGAVLVIIQSVLAGSIGPLLVGLVSDHLRPVHGEQLALQIAMLAICPTTMIIGALFGFQPLRGHRPEDRPV
ncbi:hypothetical protein ASE00_07340 [Sphingomonas sp. Root710]|uniref:MFS transporter n=1 Tax=Sphingomonas sp. Root710 TaxID=1736594 RepID=UPI0007019B5B|nr:MFS transporter [Sphingomonas sp. Root710]KRB86505.1 hypothetical protein ASE00_07340 [Sphingomonas sp. Root710]